MKFSRSDFEVFQRESQRCLRKLGLSDWHVSFQMGYLEDNLAECRADFPTMGAVFVLRKNAFGWDEPVDVKQIARHEACELLLQRLQKFAFASTAFELVVAEKHAIIRRLEKML